MAESELSPRVPPNNMLAEQSVLASMLLSSEKAVKILELITEEDFYRTRHRLLFRAIQQLMDKNEPVDIVTLANSLRSAAILEEVGGMSYLMELFGVTPTASNADYYAKIVAGKSALRRLINFSNELGRQAYGEELEVENILDFAEAELFRIGQQREVRPYHHIKDVVSEGFQLIEKLYESRAMVSGVPSGFADLDKLTTGFQKQDFIVLAARPSMGKTAFALEMLKNAALLHNIPAVFFSLEMSAKQLVLRMLCSRAKVDSKSVREIRSKARRLKREHNVGLIVIDYLQLITDPHSKFESRQMEISNISRMLKSLAREIDCPVVTLSQLSRAVEKREDKRPILSDLRESGAIEQDADLVLFLYRDEVYNKLTEDKGVAEVIIGKQRNGPLGTVRLAFLGQFTAFRDLERSSEAYPM
ncbi:MAG: replicative DNA helicase [Candidatus Wallbacteria bacterium]|nr:replicative DNA helicase [Candidatus Wallbacteria bacterium]